jgi:hypothetical protein
VQNKPCSQGTSEPDHVENTHYTDLSPGQFFLDSSRNVIMYYPLPSETDMSAVTAIMPTLEVLLSATSASDLSFTNITFAHATYARPNSPLGYVEQQSGALVDHPSNPPDCVDYEWIPTTSNLLFSGCTDVTLTGCTFLHLSAVAVEFSGGAHNNVVDACKFEDIGGAAVQIGHYDTYGRAHERSEHASEASPRAKRAQSRAHWVLLATRTISCGRSEPKEEFTGPAYRSVFGTSSTAEHYFARERVYWVLLLPARPILKPPTAKHYFAHPNLSLSMLASLAGTPRRTRASRSRATRSPTPSWSAAQRSFTGTRP